MIDYSRGCRLDRADPLEAPFQRPRPGHGVYRLKARRRSSVNDGERWEGQLVQGRSRSRCFVAPLPEPALEGPDQSRALAAR